jgi:hypothetical protein
MNPYVEVVSVSRGDDVTTTEVRLLEGKWQTPPASASLWDYDADPPRRIYDLHKCVGIDADTAMFESYVEQVETGGPYTLQGWWISDGHRAVEDESLQWCERPLGRRRRLLPPDLEDAQPRRHGLPLGGRLDERRRL